MCVYGIYLLGVYIKIHTYSIYLENFYMYIFILI